MKIYTKTGDKGETGLIGGKRISKGERRIQAYGDVDELNAMLGVAVSFLGPENQDISEILKKIQAELFIAGALLATPADYHGKRPIPRIETKHIESIEKLIDQFQTELPALEHFILPSGTRGGSLLHLARTVCRRAEREAVRLSKDEKIGEEILRYLNRLSDFLFVLARTVNHRQGAPEIPWISG